MARHASQNKKRLVRRRVRRLLVLAVVCAAVVGAVIWLVRLRDAHLTLSGEETSPTTTFASGNSTTATATQVLAPTTTASATQDVTATTTQAVTTTTKKPVATTTTTKKAVVTTTTTTKVRTDGHYVQTAVPSWELRLVNPWNPLPEGYDYTGHLANYTSGKQFDTRAMNALRQMIAAGREYNLSAASLFRPYELQVSLFQRQVQKMKNQGYTGAQAEDKAATVVARPGTSEHHLGLAADILGSGYGSLEQSFENTPAFKWLKEHCAEYGFILRYPKEKEEITGVIYEPWHYRYVGVEAATEIMSRGITLEEYLAGK